MINWFRQREKKKIVIVIASAVILTVVVIIFFGIKNKSGNSSQPPEKIGRSFSFGMAAVNNSGETGTATLAEVNGKVRVTIELSGAPGETEQPAHIYFGSCSKLGPVVYPLNALVNGQSETLLETSLDQFMGRLPLAINVRKSNPEANLSYSCANIEKAEQK
ncbi:MAG: hypothetical protein CO141_04010 [Candidatus Moranbacteria bacterium CG_4_9_14_3_um_filter_42_9]|nr:MAG: hypothetical protein CO141_04010 [Candidatus Moranbacteria bacterium CG_4_9_14_3_um_filter_42_9]